MATLEISKISGLVAHLYGYNKRMSSLARLASEQFGPVLLLSHHISLGSFQLWFEHMIKSASEIYNLSLITCYLICKIMFQ